MQRNNRTIAISLNPLRARHSLIAQRRERGVQLIEVVLVMPLLLMLLAATAEFGRYMYTYAALARATEISARYLTDQPLTGADAAAQNIAVCGKTTCNSGEAVVPGLLTGDVSVSRMIGDGSELHPATVKVRITYRGYQPVFNLANWTGGSWATITMTTSTTMRYLVDE